MTDTPTALALAPDDALEPFPAAAGGLLIGYGRVSTRGQNLDRQIRALTQCGCARIFTDKLSGKNTDRPELIECLKYLRAGDTLVVSSLDYARRILALHDEACRSLTAEELEGPVRIGAPHDVADTILPSLLARSRVIARA